MYIWRCDERKHLSKKPQVHEEDEVLSIWNYDAYKGRYSIHQAMLMLTGMFGVLGGLYYLVKIGQPERHRPSVRYIASKRIGLC